MLYENYQKKILRIAEILSKIVRHMVLIIAVVSVLAAAGVGLLVAKGAMIGELECPESIVYGDTPSVSASAFLSDVQYEYRSASEDTWVEGFPKYPGEYLVRAAAKTAFGGYRYSDEKPMTVERRKLEIAVNESKITYGEDPTPKAATSFADRLECGAFSFADLTQASTTVKAKLDTVKIFDGEGNDVTWAYSITAAECPITLTPRTIGVTVSDSSKVYDGIPLAFDGYELSSGTLVASDRLIAVFDDSITDAGIVFNTPKLTILQGETNIDVTHQYAINVTRGTLTVEKRPLIVQSGDMELVYDGQEHVQRDFILSDETPTADGEVVKCISDTKATNKGSYTNYLELAVLNAAGEDKTHNYSLLFKAGTITVLPRPMHVITHSASWIYNGQSHSHPSFEQTGLVDGHELLVESYPETQYESISNAFTVVVSASGKRLNDNYKITYSYGRLEILPRRVQITTNSGTTAPYDGTKKSLQLFEATLMEPTLSGEPQLGYGNHELIFGSWASATDAGTYENVCSNPGVVNEDGVDVTHCYSFSYRYGEFTIPKRAVILQPALAQKVYDKTPLTALHITVADHSPNDIVAGHMIKGTASGSITDAGSAQSIIESVDICDVHNVSVAQNYEITRIPGTLIVEPREIRVLTGSAQKPYDGTPLTCHEFSFPEPAYQPLEGDVLSLTITGKRTQVGQSANTCTSRLTSVYDTVAKRDVTDNYLVVYEYGVLTVYYQATLQITAGSDSKVYDGLPLTKEEYICRILEGTLADGHRVEVVVSGSQTDAGSSVNTVTSYRVLDANGNDVTVSYQITTQNGNLRVEKRRIVVYTGSAEKFYDGTSLTSSEYGIDANSPYPLVEGHVLHTTLTGVQTEVGSSENTCIDTYITDGSREVTSNYNIIFQYGQLTVKIRAIINVQTAGGDKLYDGTPLTNPEYTVDCNLPAESAEDWTITVVNIGSITDVGSIPNDPVVTVLDGEGRDITVSCQINVQAGTLTVTPRKITVYTGSAEKAYDGTPLTNPEYGVAENSVHGLLDGNTLYLEVIGKQEKAGSSENKCQRDQTRITARDGSDVTGNYQIDYAYGILTIYAQAKISIVTSTKTKVYDGTPLTSPEYDYVILEGALKSGHRLRVITTGTITEIGSVPNKANCSVVDQFGNDVTDYYDITVKYGDLTVTAPDDGEDPVPPPPQQDTVFGNLTADQSGRIYLKTQSYGDYAGTGETPWKYAFEYTSLLPGGMNYTYLTSIALQNAGYTTNYAKITESILYMLPYYVAANSGDYDMPLGDSTVMGEIVDTYSFSFYSIPDTLSDYTQLQGNLGQYSSYELQYRKYVKNNYLSIDAESYAYMRQIIAAQGFNANDPAVIYAVANYIQNAAAYDLEYDPNLDSEQNVGVAFLRDYKEGVCRHYATAATLLYRALGIPARYAEGFMIEAEAGKDVPIKNPGHAWVEVYIDGLGWICVEVTGSMSGEGPGGGEEPEELETLILTPALTHKFYDGTPLYPKNELIMTTRLMELLDLGYTYQVSITGSQTMVGDGMSTIESFVLYDPDGVDVTSQFQLDKRHGILRVYPKQVQIITLYLYERNVIYNGKDLIITEEDYEIAEMDSSLMLDIAFHIPMVDVGEIYLDELNANLSTYVSYRVYRDGADVTDEYIIVFENPMGDDDKTYIPITITKRMIEITAGSAEQIYDAENPTTLKFDNWSITMGTLAEGHYAVVTVEGSISEVGMASNEIASVKIIDEYGADVTDNYEIVAIDGTLTMLEQ